MGIIEKQAIKGTFWAYLGVVLGFITTGILFPNILSKAENGLIKLLVAYSAIFGQFAGLGFSRVTTMLFTYFRDKDKSHHGFLFLAVMVTGTGMIAAIVALLVLKPYIVGTEGSSLFARYFYYIIPLIIAVLFFTLFDTYYKVLYNAVIGTMLKEFIQRLVILGGILMFYFNWISFNTFIILYVLAFVIPVIILLISLAREGQLRFKPERGFITPLFRKKMASVSFFGILTSFSGKVGLNIDSILINALIGISQTGVYAITYYFGSIILIPARSVTKISSVVIADAWKENDLNTISKVYYKSSINQFIFAILLFIGIWANIHNIFRILPPEYLPGQYVIFFIGLSCLVQMAGGMNGNILSLSEYYRVQTYFMVVLVILLVITNYLLIPVYGIVGAALANLISNFIFNILKFLFLLIKFRLQPYNYKYILVMAIAGIAFLAGYYIPHFQNLILDIIIRSAAIALIFGSLILLFNISEEINRRYSQIRSKLFK